MADNNTDKNIHGQLAKGAFSDILDMLVSREYITGYETNYEIEDPQYGEKQFRIQFMISYGDGKQWAIKAGTSFHDRIAAYQWHCENIKRVNPNVEAAYLTYPDEIPMKEMRQVTKYDSDIQNQNIYSALDGVKSYSDMYTLIEKRATSRMNTGSANAHVGLNLEKQIVDVLNNGRNFEKWKHETELSVGVQYNLFMSLVNKLQLKKEEVDYIYATSDIPSLPERKKPKTDILIEVQKSTGFDRYTMSCKKSKEKWVSVHQYTADDFANVLNPEDDDLLMALRAFQSAGGKEALGENGCKKLERCLSPYLDRLTRWVLGGYGGSGNAIQCAEYILTCDKNTDKITVMTIDEYISAVNSCGNDGHFGTIFTWTYPKGKLGQEIQLKCRVL